MQIYLTERERQILATVSSEWCQMMASGDETFEYVDQQLDNGLGSALYKLCKGSHEQKIYEKYAKKRNK